ncbi:MAG: 50S ribosomal protein L11 methyltransferase [Gammaproteobacteria bacterium]|nr:50S ribosomal protein L11 methyltransferase [Gammaproteobacteria bacterium]
MIELCLNQVKEADVEALTELLEQFNACAITLLDAGDSPILEPNPGETPLWPTVNLSVLFEQDDQAIFSEQLICSAYPEITSTRQPLADNDWEQLWVNDAKSLCFGQRLWVCPTHLLPPPAPAVSVTLNPGLAFGTGTHPTTALCLQWLDANDVTGQTIIDYGCGSGILFIAALKLGAHKAYGIDFDPQALIASKENARINQLDASTFQLFDPAQFTQKTSVDVILANILLNPLLSLRTQFSDLLSEQGRLVVSGILQTQVAEIVGQYAPSFQVIEQHELDGWAALVFCKQK